MYRNSNILKSILGIMYALYAFYLIRTFDTFTVHCYDPYPSYSLFTFSVIILFILPKAFIVCCLVAIALLCSPCLCYMKYN